LLFLWPFGIFKAQLCSLCHLVFLRAAGVCIVCPLVILYLLDIYFTILICYIYVHRYYEKSRNPVLDHALVVQEALELELNQDLG
jgi:hypothetical protein